MINTIYIEEQIRDHQRTLEVLQHFPDVKPVICERYGEVFNPKAQNFRLQKQQPALILAKKHQRFAIPAPAGYGIGAEHNFYFSHMLNCLYDCRYCFLQGMYQSAHYVLFVNYEDYLQEIKSKAALFPDAAVHFFSGYDCDSLAFEPVTGFAEYFLPHFAQLPNTWLELRTKSTQIRNLLKRPALPRCVVAFSLSPTLMVQKQEHKTPPLVRRLQAIEKLQDRGWPIGLRFDPVLYQHDYQRHYQELFTEVFDRINPDLLHSVSLGTFRLPENYFKKIQRLYPAEKLFAGPLESTDGLTRYRESIEQELMGYCSEQLLRFIPDEKFFPCL